MHNDSARTQYLATLNKDDFLNGIIKFCEQGVFFIGVADPENHGKAVIERTKQDSDRLRNACLASPAAFQVALLKYNQDQMSKQKAEMEAEIAAKLNAKSGGCFDVTLEVETDNGMKRIGDLQYGDRLKSPRGWSPVLYLKDYKEHYYCVQIDGCVLTVDHLVYSEHGNLVRAKEVCPKQIPVEKKVRAVVVQGDSFYCGGILVSSQTHYPWLTYATPMIDMMPSYLISFLDLYVVALIEQYVG